MYGYKDQANKGEKVGQKEQDKSSYIQQKMVNSSLLLRITGDATKDLLHRSIVAIRYQNPQIKTMFSSGTGTILSNDLILTAAHNLYDKRQGRQFQKECFKIFEPTEDGFVEKFHKIRDWRYLESFKTCKHSKKLEYDYALIKIEPNPINPIKYKQFLELRPPCKCVLEKNSNLKPEIYGYPSSYRDNYEPLDKDFIKMMLFQYGLSISGGILKVDPENFNLTYAINTLGGQSGCPIVVGNQIIAIHNGAASKEEDKWNIGRLITADLVQNIMKWAKELGGIPYSVHNQIFCPHQQSISNFNQGTSKGNKLQLQKTANLLKQNTSTIAQAQQFEESASKLKQQYKYELALENYKKSLAIYQQLSGNNSIEAAAVLIFGIGDIHQQQGNYLLAVDAFERGKAICLEKEGPESYNYAVSLERIGDVYDDRAEYDAALDNYKKALTIKQKTKGKDSLEAGMTINNIGLVYWKKGDYPQALQYLKRSLQIKERAGKGNSIEAAHTHNNIGAVYKDQKEYSLALQHYEKALEIDQRIKGKDSVDAASTMRNIGIVYRKQGDFPRAVEMYKRVIAIYEKHQLRHRSYANVHLCLGNAYYSMKQYGSAATAYRVALPIFEQMGLAAQVKESSLSLAQCLSRLGKKEEFEIIIDKYGEDRKKV